MKKMAIIILVIILIFLCIVIYGTFWIFYSMHSMRFAAKPDIVEKAIKTPYGDGFCIEHEIDGADLFKPTKVYFRFYCSKLTRAYTVRTGLFECPAVLLFASCTEHVHTPLTMTQKMPKSDCQRRVSPCQLKVIL